MIEGPFPTNEPKGVLMNENMIDEKYKEEVLKLEIGEASPIYLHEGKELVFLRTQWTEHGKKWKTLRNSDEISSGARVEKRTTSLLVWPWGSD